MPSGFSHLQNVYLLLQDFGSLQKQALLANGVATKQEQGLVLVILLCLEDVDDIVEYLSTSRASVWPFPQVKILAFCASALMRDGQWGALQCMSFQRCALDSLP